MGGMNMRLKLAKVRRIKDGQGQHRICILSGERLAWMLDRGMELGAADLAAVLEKEYRRTCRQARILTREQSLAARAAREAQLAAA
jgi:hypothetical protein